MSHISMIVAHWRKLANTVHPEDQKVFDIAEHTFNLDWPPPAYIGDVVNAPYVLLMMNGGYDPQFTPTEFSHDDAIKRYIDLLHNPRPIDPKLVSPYYTGNYGEYIRTGRLALVNAVAYRSGKLSGETKNKKLAHNLPSTLLHRQWLRNELIPQALSGDRKIIAHRNRMWQLDRDEYNHPNIIFTRSAVSSSLPREVLALLWDDKTAQH